MRESAKAREVNDGGAGGSRWRTLLAAVLVLSIATTIATAAGGEEPRRVRFIPSSRWGWVNSGVWKSGSLIVVDSLGRQGREFRLTENGTELREVGVSHLLPEGSSAVDEGSRGQLSPPRRVVAEKL